MYDPEHPEPEQWEKEFRRARGNAVFFIEQIWNKAHPEAQIHLTDEQKQIIYQRYRIPPHIHDLTGYMQRLEELRAKGYKDWEIDA